MDAKWVEGKNVWTYYSSKLGVLGMVWRDLDLYAATAGAERGYPSHAEWGEYSTLREAKDIVEGIASGAIQLTTSRPRSFGEVTNLSDF